MKQETDRRVPKDLRGHLEHLTRQGKLLTVHREVDTRFEIAAGIRKTSDTDGPALLFENIKGFAGWKVAAGVYATQKLLALSLGLPKEATEEVITECYLDYSQKGIQPKRVTSGPIKEIVLKGREIDLRQLPVPVYSELDVGPYLAAGVEIGKHPKTGVQNASMHRRLILGKNHTTLLAREFHHLGMMIEAAEKEGKSLPVATVVGAPPALSIASIVEAPEGVDEAYIAGAFQGEALEVIPCETIDVEVPAYGEIVIEGRTIPHEREWDGPFGEFPGNYITLLGEPRSKIYIIEVTAITMRKNPIFQALLTGMPTTENHILKKWSLAAAAHLKIGQLADIKAINLTGSSTGLHMIVAINKKDENEPMRIIQTMLSARHGPKHITVVDEDINVYDPHDVEWAVATRVMVDRGIITLPGTSRTGPLTAGKIGIDATAPIQDRRWYQKAKVPGVERVDYL